MKKILPTGFLFFLSTALTPAQGQDLFARLDYLFTPPLQYVAYQASGPVSVDGKLTEASWQAAPWSADFADIEGKLKPTPTLRTRMKMIWDSEHLYIAAELEEPHVWAKLLKHDEIIFQDNDFEVFIDPEGDMHNYFEIEVNAFNTIFDLMLGKAYRDGGPAIIAWDAKNLRSAVHVKGTINQPGDKDENWVVEMAIPFMAMGFGPYANVPKDKDTWRINFSRVQWDTDIVNGTYVKKTDPVTKHPLPEHNWVWSPQGAINMHMPDRWGYVHFSTQKPGTVAIDMALPATESLKKYLWLLYYQQREYNEKHHQFATELSQLKIPAQITEAGMPCSISLEGTRRQYIATIKPTEGSGGWRITHEGNIHRLH